MKGNFTGKVKKTLAAVMTGAMVLTSVATPAFMNVTTVYAAEDTVCHIGTTYYATVDAALSVAEAGATIVLDKTVAAFTVAQEVKVDAGTTDFDLDKVTTTDGSGYCSVVSGTVKSFAKEVPTEFIFTWDTSKTPATAKVSVKCNNGHILKDGGKDEFNATVTAKYYIDDKEVGLHVTLSSSGHILENFYE